MNETHFWEQWGKNVSKKLYFLGDGRGLICTFQGSVVFYFLPEQEDVKTDSAGRVQVKRKSH